ncbi:uncharacterized protein [Amphiura filiformis]|uniref:uncharacterized protein n=1 Tax=Amphiura filiformis TaxID=82378 RepID=UPI003B21E9F5
MIVAEENQKTVAKGIVRFKAKGGETKRQKDNYGNYLSSLSTIQYKYPLKLMVPQFASSNNCHWVYSINYGGGLVSGDEIALQIDVEEGCSALLTTQGSTKVYHSVDGKTSTQSLTGSVGPRGLLAIIQEPLVCFKDAKYKQTQNFHMEGNSNLVFVDWITSGRVANGERWDFTSCSTTNNIFLGTDLVYRDAMRLSNTENLSVKDTMKHYNIVASCVVLGPDLTGLIQHIKDDVGKGQNIGELPDPNLIVSASPLQYAITNSHEKLSGVMVKCASSEITKVYWKLDNLLKPLYPKLGGNPFENKY